MLVSKIAVAGSLLSRNGVPLDVSRGGNAGVCWLSNVKSNVGQLWLPGSNPFQVESEVISIRRMKAANYSATKATVRSFTFRY